LLVWDRNGNGKIDNGLELFGSAVEDGFAALARQDGNRDGKIDASDAIFANLRVWRDVNGNGLTEAGELLTTEQAGIRVIDLAKTASGADNAGNRVDYTGTFTRTDGRTGVSAAISFAVNQTLARWTAPEDFTPSEEAQKLPLLNGYGRLKDLAAAATTDAALLARSRPMSRQSPRRMRPASGQASTRCFSPGRASAVSRPTRADPMSTRARSPFWRPSSMTGSTTEPPVFPRARPISTTRPMPPSAMGC
jgi:hypothetical protein